MAHTSVQPHRIDNRAPSGRAVLAHWAAISAAGLTISLLLLCVPQSPKVLLREVFERDASGTLIVGRDDCGFIRSVNGGGGAGGGAVAGGPGGVVFITLRERISAVVVWEETHVIWRPSPPPAAEVDAALERRGFVAEARRVAALPAGTTTTLRPSAGLFHIPLFSILLVEPSFMLRRRWLERRARIRTSHGYCGACGYDRRGTTVSEVCPECGRLE